jgi:hypothetical protein
MTNISTDAGLNHDREIEKEHMRGKCDDTGKKIRNK